MGIPTVEEHGFRLCTAVFVENCTSSNRRTRELSNMELINNLKKKKDWNYALAIDSLSSIKILMSRYGRSLYSVKPDFDNWKYSCGQCSSVVYWAVPDTLDRIKFLREETPSYSTVFGTDCISTKDALISNCSSSRREGTMGQITCSNSPVALEQHLRFRRLSHQLESDVCNVAGIRVRDCERSAPTYRTYIMTTIGVEYKLLSNANLDIRTTHSQKGSYLEELLLDVELTVMMAIVDAPGMSTIVQGLAVTLLRAATSSMISLSLVCQ